MRMPKPAQRWITAAMTWMVFLTGVPATYGLGQPTPPPDNARPPDPAETWRSDATRLIAAMGPHAPIDTKVARLIDRLARDPEQVQAVVTALTMLGPAAVPAIIRQMDDRREMPVRGISFVNRSPNAFEGLRHYSVEKVVDCLDYVLNDITGESFGTIDVGGGPHGPDPARSREREAQRTATVTAWRGYLARSRATLRQPRKTLPLPDRAKANAPRFVHC